MTYFLASAFLFLLFTLHETHNYVPLSQRLEAEAEGKRRPHLDDWKAGLQRRHELQLGRNDADARYSSTNGTTTAVSDDAGDDNALIAGSRGRKRPQKISQRSSKRVASCYMCNIFLPNWNAQEERRLLYYIPGIPYETLCDDAWDSSDHTHVRMRLFLRSRCFLEPNRIHMLVEPTNLKKPVRYDRGIMRNIYGNFTGGCFKRFLDVGKVYTARGCRGFIPLHSSGFASHRFQYLEALLMDQKEGCLSSPFASLTPFSRGVSLYVYYHVCVCSGKYCNKAPAPAHPTPASWPLLLILSIYLVI